MKYSVEIIINAPRKEVVQKLEEPENLKHWQRGLISYKHLHNKDMNNAGAKMQLHYKMGKREMVLTETILVNNLPSELHATYDTKGVHNIQKNYFKEVDESTTEWISESEFQFGSFGMKMMGFLMPGAFKKQSRQYMRDFKAFVEDGASVSKE
ncbi:SRPBCC family protein [Luteirhabdus pelagi]|uniref:SRPBCC family protein n=1 Tax=Luteirhabdus pelagi TaxID=2792783 RepID=UPI00193A410E|nr:SRPBCC family protein [Luteirhabdus pelagi]